MNDKASGCGCWKGCGIGCGCLIVIAIGLAVLTAITVVKPLNRVVTSRESLESRFGAQADYVPPVNGIPADERLRAFITVREALAPACTKISAIADEMKAMERFDDQKDGVSKIEVMQQAMKTTQAAMTMAPALGQFFEARNAALLEVGMGLGEYTYIYVLAYHDQLLSVSGGDIFGDRNVNRRIHDALLEMLKAQRGATPVVAEAPIGVSALDQEIQAMAADVTRIPWQDGLPAMIAAALKPHRPALDEVFCQGAVSLELLRNRKRAWAVESE